MGTLRWIALVLLAVGIAQADDRPPTDKLQGFVAPSTGQLSGRVVDSHGHPIAKATVHFVTKSGESTVTTDKDGRYRANIKERPTLVFVQGGASISGGTVTTQIIDEQETIEVKDVEPPTKPAKALTDASIIPEYTEAAMDSNQWARAWLLLDVDPNGVVARIKLLNAPGDGLDEIAIRDGFKLKFEPARDRSDKAVRSQVLWVFEWPSFWWMQDRRYQRRRMPREAYRTRCRGTGPTKDVYRNCAPPNLAAAITETWIDRPRK
jgi:hypothetical protein